MGSVFRNNVCNFFKVTSEYFQKGFRFFADIFIKKEYISVEKSLMTVPFKQLANKVLQFLFISSASFTIVVKSLWYVQNASPSTLVLMVNCSRLEWASALLTMGYFSCNLLNRYFRFFFLPKLLSRPRSSSSECNANKIFSRCSLSFLAQSVN